jgi:murein DD-endopeptidase MepM/ murein hydrolase activator NlpD
MPFLLGACAEPARPIATSFESDEMPHAGDLLERRWRETSAALLLRPTRITAPFADRGTLLAHEARGRAYAFTALEGQTLRIELDRADVTAGPEGPHGEGAIFIDLYRIAWRGSSRRLARVDGISLGAREFSVRLPRTGEYLLRIQPDLLINAHFGLRLELSAALAFPVPSRGLAAVRSVFGDPRDGGARRHEGVDIFAPRLTPVVAVADGRAVPRQNDLGGNVVYLNAAGVSYYYAHLERAAIERPRRVRAGDVLGFIGNTGNAAATPPHLHFGIYDWGRSRGAVDPIPQLTAYRFEEDAPELPGLPAEAPRLSTYRLEQSRGGTIVWLPSPAKVYALVEPGSLAPPGARGELSHPGPLDAVISLAYMDGAPARDGTLWVSDTSAPRHDIAWPLQLRHGMLSGGGPGRENWSVSQKNTQSLQPNH